MLMNENFEFGITRDRYDQANDNVKYTYIAQPGINEETVRKISELNNEPEWMLAHRLNSLKIFHTLKIPTWGPNLSNLDMNKIIYFLTPDAKKNSKSWDDVPA